MTWDRQEGVYDDRDRQGRAMRTLTGTIDCSLFSWGDRYRNEREGTVYNPRPRILITTVAAQPKSRLYNNHTSFIVLASLQNLDIY